MFGSEEMFKMFDENGQSFKCMIEDDKHGFFSLRIDLSIHNLIFKNVVDINILRQIIISVIIVYGYKY